METAKKDRENMLRLKEEERESASEAQGEELRALAEDIRREYERRREERRSVELIWRLNQNFLMGNQYCDVVEESGEMIDTSPGAEWERRSVYNMIAPIVETRLAKLGRIRPGMTVRPMTEEAEDIAGARLATRLLKAAYDGQGMAEKQLEAILWAEICGSVFYKTAWDPRGGYPLGVLEGEVVHEGDLATAVVPAYEIFPDCCAREGLQNQPSIIHARVYDVEEIERLWGVRVQGRRMDVSGADALSLGTGGYHPMFGQGRQEQMENAALVLEYYERPGVRFPRGRHVIVAGEYVAHAGELPGGGEEGGGEYPLIQQFCLRSPGRFFGASVIERLIPLQRDYNAINNRINEHAARMTAGNLVAEQGALVNEDLLDSGIAPGTVIEYRAGATPPGWMRVEEIPQTLLSRLADMRRQFVDISGVSEMARSSTTSGPLSSGVALEILKEQDDTRLSLTADHMREALRRLGRRWIHLFKTYALGVRLTRAAGEDLAQTALVAWRRETLTSDDVTVEVDGEASDSPAQRRQLTLELMRAGLFLDPDTQRLSRESRARLMEIFRLGNWENLAGTDELHRHRAQAENGELLRGVTPRITPLDDHALHLAEHTRFALSAEFRRLERERPELCQALTLHAQGHRALAGEGNGNQ